MSKSFFVVDKLNVVAKECFPLVRFNYDDSDFLIYYSILDENNKCDIFISKLLKSNGIYKIENISLDFKNFFSSLVHDILEFPSLYTKDSDIDQLFTNFSEKHDIEFLARFPILGDQDSDNNFCLVNIDMDYITYVNYFYSNAIPKLKKRTYVEKFVDSAESGPVQSDNSVWPVPSSVSDAVKTGVSSGEVIDSDIPAVATPNSTFFDGNVDYNQMYNADNYSFMNNGVPNTFDVKENNNNIPNNSNLLNGNFAYPNTNSYYSNVTTSAYDSYNSGNLNNTPVQNNMPLANQNAGYASSKYIIIGTICLILASLIVAASIVIVNRL